MKRLLFAAFLIAALATACSQGKQHGASPASDSDSAVAEQQQKQLPDSLTFAFMGDIMPGTTFPESPEGAYVPKDGGKELFADCREVFKASDVVAGNLEGVLIEGGTPKFCKDPKLCFTFRIPPFMAQVFKDEGFDYMNLANNHANDFGVEGTESSHSVLEKAGIASAGIRGVAPTAVIEKNGVKIGFTGFSTGVTTLSALDPEELKRTVTELRKHCDILVVALHAGGEGAAYTHVPRKEEVFHGWPRGDVWKFARTAIDCGADIVWGHGPHLARGMEVYKDRLVMYSLGNFCTPYRMGIAGLTGQAPLVQVTVRPDGTFLGGKIHSMTQQKGIGPRLDPGHAAARQIKKLSLEDFPESPLKISDTGELTK